jgi:hypothetical protein
MRDIRKFIRHVNNQERTMAELALTLAERARRAALIQTVRQRPDLTIEQLRYLLSTGNYGDELSRITVDELVQADIGPPAFSIRAGEQLEDAVLRVFHQLPGRELTSGFFCRYMRLERWTAQKLLAELAERGLLVRSGKTSGTRYTLPSEGRFSPPRSREPS